MTLNPQLFRKYNVPGPRYTSYPTVPYWESSPTQDEWLRSIRTALESGEKQGVGAALYLHIPFCKSLCTYCGCNTRITRNESVGVPYVQTLLKEWQLYLKHLGRSQANPVQVSEIHLGGGTPTFLSPQELSTLLSGLLKEIKVLPGAEFSLEADPRVTSKEQLKVLAEFGFKRLSLGIQDFDPKVQEVVNRVQSVAEVQKITELARELGFESINYDLIYGLPFQTLQSVQNTVEHIQTLRPDRIAFYAYAHVPWIKPGQRKFTEADLPSAENKRALYELGRTMLEASGYLEVGMDHFALKTDSLWKAFETKTLHRNFMGYTSRQVAPLIGLGVSSIGDSWSVFAQNEKMLEKYQARVEAGELPLMRGHVLDAEDLVIRRHILNLMTQFETHWEEELQSSPFLGTVSERLTEFSKDGIITLQNGHCKVGDEGRPFLRNICMAFDARLVRKAPATQLFSKTI